MDVLPREMKGEIFGYITTLNDIYAALLTSKEFYEYVHSYVALIESDKRMHTPDLWIAKFKNLRELNVNVIAHLSEGPLPCCLKIGTIVFDSTKKNLNYELKGKGWDLRFINDKETFSIIVQGSKWIGVMFAPSFFDIDKEGFKIIGLEELVLPPKTFLLSSITKEYLEEIVIPSFEGMDNVKDIIQTIKDGISSCLIDADILSQILIPHYQLLSVNPLLVEKGYQLMEKYKRVDRKDHLSNIFCQQMCVNLDNIHTFKLNL